jgi:hypothetical protein
MLNEDFIYSILDFVQKKRRKDEKTRRRSEEMRSRELK